MKVLRGGDPCTMAARAVLPIDTKCNSRPAALAHVVALDRQGQTATTRSKQRSDYQRKIMPNPSNPLLYLFRSMAKHRHLIAAMAKREVTSRYRSSFLGFTWAVLQPVFMLAVYTFAFSEVLKGRWPGGTGSKAEFALVLFAGLLVFNVFSEVFNRSPELILANTNYVKRVIFPLEILSVVSVISATFNLLINLVVWLIFYTVAIGNPHLTVLLFPIAILPMLIFLVGISWIFAAIGTYIRDLAHVTPIITTAFMFLSPIFFPIEAIPERFRPILGLNPLAAIIKQVRDVLLWGRGIELWPYVWSLLTALLVLVLGFLFFQRVRKGFADVL